MPWLGVPALGAASAILALGVWLDFAACWRLVRRMRVLLLALIVLYAFATPGAPLFSAWETPTFEGLLAGVLQAWRLLLMLVALAMILTRLKPQQLLAGIYGLLLPFKPLGFPLERTTARLWLTLQYAEAGLQGATLRERWDDALAMPTVSEVSVTLDIPALRLRDVLCLMAFCVLLLGALAW